VREWVWDCYDESYGDTSGNFIYYNYAQFNPQATDPTGGSDGTYRVLRSGSYDAPDWAASYLRSACRYKGAPEKSSPAYGLRLAKPAD
jgi:formylglycine-generating enzyme required for sulfatase activity